MNVVDDRRVRLLIESMAQAAAAGRSQDAASLLRQARAEAPQHPLVLNETAREMLVSGNPAAAADLLQQAIKGEPAHVSMWLNLAVALRSLKRADEEMAALDKVLAIEPHHLRAMLQKASLLELQGNSRGAAAAYRTALQTIPAGADLPVDMRPVLQHATQVIASNNRVLESFLEERLKNVRARHADQALDRFEQCLATLLQKERIYRPQPSFMYFPRLPAIEFPERGDFPWLDPLEAAVDDVRQEIFNVLADGPETLEPYVTLPTGSTLEQFKELNHSRRWGVYYLWREGVPVVEHLARCPRTVAVLEAMPRWDVSGSGPSALFSILDAKTRIPPHSGVTNARLFVHFPLIVPPGCGFRVGAQRREWHPGKAFIFDDTFEHEAWNDSDVPRAVLIFDIWSPFLSAAERDLVRATTGAVAEYYGGHAPRGI